MPRLWAHQAAAAEHAYAGRSVMVTTGTASGKSLCYQLPILSTLEQDEQATALYLAPTKALATDQLQTITTLPLPSIRAAAYDGDTPETARAWARAHGRWIFTNPDMVHHALLARHEQWRGFFRRLRYVVIDECHAYRGVFGSHVALVFWRLWRIATHYGSAPTAILTSATVGAPQQFAERLIGRDVQVVAADASPRGPIKVQLVEPPGKGAERQSTHRYAAELLAALARDHTRTLVFVRSRRGAETVAATARRLIGTTAPGLVGRIATYRAGYLPAERREIEEGLRSGALLGAATTNALELGINITGLDAVVLAGYPGSIAAFWQQAGRAGRDGRAARVIFIPDDNPLDKYLVRHPEAIFDSGREAPVLDPTNPYVLGPQLCAALAELPMRHAEIAAAEASLATSLTPLLAGLAEHKLVRQRSTGWYWTAQHRIEAPLRGAAGEPIAVVEAATGRLLGTVDAAAAVHAVHPGAVYLHRGASFLVETLDLDDKVALVRIANPDWTTQPRTNTDISILATAHKLSCADVTVGFGTVAVQQHTTGYVRRRIATGEFLDHTPLDLPPRHLTTKAVWIAFPEDSCWDDGTTAGTAPERGALAGSAHAAEHALIGLLPLFATCERADIGGLSTIDHPDTGVPTIFVYDGHAGGAGFAERGFTVLAQWIAATRDLIADCPCTKGCPSCVQSPKCGNGNEPLNKAGAHRLLIRLSSLLDTHRTSAGLGSSRSDHLHATGPDGDDNLDR